MIKINLSPNSKFRDLNEFSEAYYNLLKKDIISKANDFLTIYNYQNEAIKPDISRIDGDRIKKIISLLSKNKYRLKNKSLARAETQNRNKFLKWNIFPDFSDPSKKSTKKKYVQMLNFFIENELVDKKEKINIKKLLSDQPFELEKYSKILNKTFSSLLKTKIYINVIDYLLDYTAIHENKEIRALFFENININVCPYCNRNYISYIQHSSSKIIGPTLDHFLSKSENRFLSASFYNLVPSCYVCNSNLKGSGDTTNQKNLNPYMEGFGTAATFKLLNPPFRYSVKLEIDEKSPISKKIMSDKKDTGNAVMFKINEIYSIAHIDEIKLIVDKCDKLNSHFSTNIEPILGDNASSDEFYEFYFHNFNNEINFNRKPLSKLTKDLVEERLKWIL